MSRIGGAILAGLTRFWPDPTKRRRGPVSDVGTDDYGREYALEQFMSGQRHGSPLVYLTRVGGGAFGNDGRWIAAAIQRALAFGRHAGLDVRIVSYSTPDPSMLELVRQFAVS